MRHFAMAAFGVLIAVAAPALADTKAGFDMWNRGDYFGAVKEWRPAAIAGDPVAQFNLARAYQLGRGVPLDLKMAESWFGKAAKQGHEPSRDNYGLVLFQNGDRQAALPYLEESAARGEPRAQYVLGTALFNGDMVKTNWVRAYALMTRASAAGIGAASSSLAQMDKYIPLDQRQQGLVLARSYETAASRPQATDLIGDTVPPRSAVVSQELPPSEVGAPPMPRVAEAPVPSKPVKPVTPAKPPAPIKVAVAPAVTKPAAAPKAAPKAVAEQTSPAAKTAAPSGNWKVQLGAFGDSAKANRLWSGLHKRIAALGPYRAFVVPAGAITRLQAGPLPSRDAAEKLCASVKAAGQACIPVAPPS